MSSRSPVSRDEVKPPNPWIRIVERWPNATVFDGNVAAADVAGKVVAGTLPPFLAGLVAGYYPVQVVGYDAAREGDVNDTTRIVIGEPITVTVS